MRAGQLSCQVGCFGPPASLSFGVKPYYTMITGWQVQRKAEAVILGLAVGHAHLDVVTTHALLASCLRLLKAAHTGLVEDRMGQFGDFPVTLNIHHDDAVSIFIDGPDFGPSRCQSAAIWVDKGQLEGILEEVLRET